MRAPKQTASAPAIIKCLFVVILEFLFTGLCLFSTAWLFFVLLNYRSSSQRYHRLHSALARLTILLNISNSNTILTIALKISKPNAMFDSILGLAHKLLMAGSLHNKERLSLDRAGEPLCKARRHFWRELRRHARNFET
jgi:hypothetical protein